MSQQGMAEQAKETIVAAGGFNDSGGKLLRALAVEQPRAAHKCSRTTFCLFAIGGSAPYDGSGFLACARKRLLQLVRAAEAPRIGPCPGSSGSGHRAC